MSNEAKLKDKISGLKKEIIELKKKIVELELSNDKWIDDYLYVCSVIDAIVPAMKRRKDPSISPEYKDLINELYRISSSLDRPNAGRDKKELQQNHEMLIKESKGWNDYNKLVTIPAAKGIISKEEVIKAQSSYYRIKSRLLKKK